MSASMPTDLPALFEKVREFLALDHIEPFRPRHRADALAALDEIAERQHVVMCECHRLWPRDEDCAALRKACKGEK